MPVVAASSKDEFDTLLQGTPKFAVVYFWASWATPCVQMTAVFEKIASFGGDAAFISVEAEAVPLVAQKFNVTSVPMIAFAKPDGTVFDVVVGAHAPVLVGKVNRDIVASINTHGALAVGLSGEDGGLIEANRRDPELGFVGDVANINPAIVESLLAQNLIPVVSTIGADLSGQSYNINADTVAGAIAGALGATKVIYLTDIAGLLRDVDDQSSLIAQTTPSEIAGLIADGVLSGGMIPKVEACLEAINAGVPAAHMLDGRVPHVVLLELFTKAGVGTMITSEVVA